MPTVRLKVQFKAKDFIHELGSRGFPVAELDSVDWSAVSKEIFARFDKIIESVIDNVIDDVAARNLDIKKKPDILNAEILKDD